MQYYFLQLSQQKVLDKAAVEQLIDQLRKQNNTLASNLEQKRNKNLEDTKVRQCLLSFHLVDLQVPKITFVKPHKSYWHFQNQLYLLVLPNTISILKFFKINSLCNVYLGYYRKLKLNGGI